MLTCRASQFSFKLLIKMTNKQKLVNTMLAGTNTVSCCTNRYIFHKVVLIIVHTTNNIIIHSCHKWSTTFMIQHATSFCCYENLWHTFSCNSYYMVHMYKVQLKQMCSLVLLIFVDLTIVVL